MKKQKLYMLFVGLFGIAVFGISLYQTFALFTDPQTLFDQHPLLR
jgi:hypothetical protein